jgi:hypothetical protein
MGTDRSISRGEQAERRFPWRVDVPVPGLGLQQRLTAMLDWCERRLGGALDGWDQHGITIPIHVARFYFVGAADALAFVSEWGGEVWQYDAGAARPDEGEGR